MNTYTKLGESYLQQASLLQKRVQKLRAENRQEGWDPDRYWRLQQYYAMYLECRVTGHYLCRRGKERDALA